MTKPSKHGSSIPMRERIVPAVNDLFYRGGTYRVGVDHIVQHLRITRATLYRHFNGKEALIVAYLKYRHDLVSAQIERIISGKNGAPAILAIFDDLTEKTNSKDFRGCAFLIAVTENPGSEAIYDVARTHKKFLHQVFHWLLPDDDDTSEQLLILYEGVLAASVLRPDTLPAEAARRAAVVLLRSDTLVFSEEEA